MSVSRFHAVFVVLLATFVATGHGYQSSIANRPWPPGLQKIPEGSPALSPEEAVKTFYMPPGYRVELVASEPLIQEPVAIDWDTEGRLWAVEMPLIASGPVGVGDDSVVCQLVGMPRHAALLQIRG